MTVTSQVSSGTHAVLLYEGEPSLYGAVERFVAPALGSGASVAMIASRQTLDAVTDRLAVRSDVPSEAASRIIFVEADATLGRIMNHDLPDPERFQQAFAELLATLPAGATSGGMRIYGEMVDVLCQIGNHAAAVRLEELWNQQFAGSPTSVMCGYAIDRFDSDTAAKYLRAVCRQHTHVLWRETDAGIATAQPQGSKIALRQHRTRLRARTVGYTPIVYVVDDDASVRSSLERLITTASLPVRTFESAEDFLANVESTASGVLIVDVQLLGMSGTELQRQMARAGWSMPVIAISASDDVRIESEAMTRGARVLLRKPFDAEALLDSIARALP